MLRVALPAGLPCANAVPHITLGTAEGVAPWAEVVVFGGGGGFGDGAVVVASASASTPFPAASSPRADAAATTASVACAAIASTGARESGGWRRRFERAATGRIFAVGRFNARG